MWHRSDIVYRDYVDISVAVSSPTGLVVPVLRNVQVWNNSAAPSLLHRRETQRPPPSLLHRA